MAHLLYLGLLAGCLVGTAPLEFFLKAGVYRRWRRVLPALLPGFAVCVLWDSYAVHARHWFFDARYITGIKIGNLPIEEVLFFLVVPLCAVQTLEAVRGRRPDWRIGDEPRSADRKDEVEQP